MELFAFFSIFIIGLSYGATACMFSCMPFLSPLIINNSNNTKQSLGIILPFSIGRIVSYSLLAIFAYLSSTLVKSILNDNYISNTILGISTITMGVFLIYKSFNSVNLCKKNLTFMNKSKFNKFGLFLIGITISINPCAPIMALLAITANSTSFINALSLGLFFGLGAVLFSIIFYGFLFSKIIKGLMLQFSSYKIWIERFAAIFLILVGLSVLNGILTL